MGNFLGFITAYLTVPITWWCLIFGAIVGSFLNVCILRIPAGTFFKQARSHCPHCNQVIPIYRNLPVLSFLLQRGRSACCHQTLSWQYPVVELLTAVGCVVLYWQTPFLDLNFGLAADSTLANGDILGALNSKNLLRFIHAGIFCALLVVCAFIDLRLMIIPDVISLPMIAASPLVAWLHPDLQLTDSLLGVLGGGGLLYGIAWLYWLLRREVGMGMGDVKLLAAIGGWLGFQAVVPTVFFGSILGAAVGLLAIAISGKMGLRSSIPFGPFLAIGAIIHLIFGAQLNELLLYF